MSVKYSVTVNQPLANAKLLGNNNYNLHIAKSVASALGAPHSFNVVYSSQNFYPNMSVTWTGMYGLGYLTDIPAPGAKVTYNGHWQPCTLGESYDIDSNGLWVPNQNDPSAKSDSLNIGNNNYMPVFVIVGLSSDGGETWHPIWVSPSPLLLHAHANYAPSESVQLWFQEDLLDGTMITGQQTPVQEWDMTDNPNCSFSYDANKGEWRTPSPIPFPELIAGS